MWIVYWRERHHNNWVTRELIVLNPYNDLLALEGHECVWLVPGTEGE